MKKTLLLLLLLPLATGLRAQTQIETSELSALYTTTTPTTISIHDPSVVYQDGMFYIWGSHLGVARSQDLVSFTSLTAGSSTFRKLSEQGATSGTACTYASAFNTQQVTQVKGRDGSMVTMPNFDAAAYCCRYSDDPNTWLSGDMWAPDIIWNDEMQKWCMYLSLNGDNWSSIIILLTSDSPTSGFTYQAPIVMGGFDGQTYNGVEAPTYADTDLDIALGETLTATPSRYLQSANGTYWPNCIDPCVFYDEEGELWMTYGSWSGGIFMLKLDKETGLRDYTYTYESDFDTKGASCTSDPYFGKKIAGGYYVSGEGSYVQHIGKYYYLFMSYGGYAPDGGYDMRVFRSTSPDGPYTDALGNEATYTAYVLNYDGTSSDAEHGMRLVGAYNEWGGIQDVGERAQGHNSACADDQGRTFLVYHTKFNDGTEGHQVRVHQLFLNQKDWLVCSPFIYQGETETDETIASSQTWTTDELAGDYEVLIHPFGLDYLNYEEIVPSLVNLSADGTVTGELTGTWGITEGTDYMWIKVSGTTYYGVWCEQSINGATTDNLKETSLKAVSFTSVASSGVPFWGYKLEPQSAIAWNYANNTINLKDGQTVSSNVSLMFDTDNNTTLTWTSSEPDIINETGKYNPADTATDVTMTVKLECGDYFWQEAYDVKASKATTPSGDYLTGLVAYYNFDEKPTYNQYKPDTETDYDRATYGAFSSGTAATLESDWDRFGQVAHTEYGASGNNSYVRVPNPLKDQDIDGFTVSLWVKPNTEDLWDALWGFFNTTTASSSSSARFFLTGNTYLGYTDQGDNSFDINYPDKTYTDIPVGEWTLVTVTVGASNYVSLYINGTKKTLTIDQSSGSSTALRNLPYEELVSSVQSLRYFYLGNGTSTYGSADACFDDLMIYNRELSRSDVSALNTMANRVTDFTVGEGGTDVEDVWAAPKTHSGRYTEGTYDLSGRRITKPVKGGVYIENGKKIVK
ncbi:MAG: family 43 glycosylhydrolase [Prevotellaceae bacterium]|nr:family 43 glycosylhydrolase [Prevotellaceae bacterium]